MRLQLLLMAVVGVALAGGLGAWELTRIGVHQGYGPEQPIAFPHKVHAGDNKIPCLYCHYGARTSRHAGIPPASVCMNCHSILEKQTVEIEKLKEAVQQERPIRWVKVTTFLILFISTTASMCSPELPARVVTGRWRAWCG